MTGIRDTIVLGGEIHRREMRIVIFLGKGRDRRGNRDGGIAPLNAISQRPFLEPSWNGLWKSECAFLCSDVGGWVSW